MKANNYKRFKYRIKPHEILKEEYPQSYYKFRDGRVASAFFYGNIRSGSEKTSNEKSKRTKK